MLNTSIMRLLSVCVLLLIKYQIRYVVSSVILKENLEAKDILMPGIKPTQNDEYYCLSQPITYNRSYIVGLEAKADASKAHHILLFGCRSLNSNPSNGQKYWKCGEGFKCDGMKIMFAWGKNAPPLKLPNDVGFEVGRDTSIKLLVLEVHYAMPLKEPDHSGLQLTFTTKPPRFHAGIFILLSAYTSIPPRTEKVHADVNCLYTDEYPIYPFAYRVHAHSLGVVISGYKFDPTSNEWTLLGKGNPQWPQAFYTMNTSAVVKKNDILASRCTFNSTLRDRFTYIGSTANDEMCNFYIMFYYDARFSPQLDTCIDTAFPQLVSEMPYESDIPLPRNAVLEEHALHGTGMGSSGGSHDHALETNNNRKDDNQAHTNSGEIFTVNKKGHGFEDTSDYVDYDSSSSPVGSQRPGGISYNGDFFQPGQSGNSGSSGQESSPSSPSSPYDMQNQGPIQWPWGAGPRIPQTNNESQGKALNGPSQKSLYNDVSKWPQLQLKLGQVTAVVLDSKSNVVVFHRANIVWNMWSFDLRNKYRNQRDGLILSDTVLILNSQTGELIKSWGKDLFYMPHGLFIDKDENVWTTDVALHQVMKFPPGGGTEPLLVLGTKFEPGSGYSHFCKPTSVVVSSSGEIFVADGYCNSRIVKYSAKGEFLLQWGRQTPSILGVKIKPPQYAFDVPHSLALAEDRGVVYVADRENGRIQSFYLANGTIQTTINSDEFNGKLFAVSYSPSNGMLYAVNGPSNYLFTRGNVKGFVIDVKKNEIVGYFYPRQTSFSNPHDVISTNDGRELYVVEIGPNKIWKMQEIENSGLKTSDINEVTVATKQPVAAIDQSNGTSQTLTTHSSALVQTRKSQAQESTSTKQFLTDVTRQTSNITASIVIMALLAIPVLFMVVITVVIRMKKKGKLQCNLGHVKGWMTGYKSPPNPDRFSVSNLLNRHKGFDPVSVEESDGDGEGSDSDIEEYSAGVQKA